MVTPRPSATVVLLRDAKGAPEILFVKRRSGDAFGESWTFPGGVLDADEENARGYCAGRSADEADAILGEHGIGLDYYSAAVRECFEETGVLLARNRDSQFPKIDANLASTRTALFDNRLAWADFLEEHELTIACDALHYFAHWITPENLPMRWSTRFFMAKRPDGQRVSRDDREIVDHCWLTAENAVRDAQDGVRELPFPTLRTVSLLADLDSVDAMLAWAQNRSEDGVPSIQPIIRSDGSRVDILVPGDPDFPDPSG